MIAQELEVSLHMAFVEARQKRHEFITVEHLLLALIDNPSAADALRAVRGLAHRIDPLLIIAVIGIIVNVIMIAVGAVITKGKSKGEQNLLSWTCWARADSIPPKTSASIIFCLIFRIC